MIKNTLEISFSGDYDDDFDWFDVTIQHRELKLHCSFLQHIALWESFGDELSRFPQNVNSTILFNSAAPELRLEAYCYDLQGHTALRVWFESQEPDPNRSRFEFSIPAEAASLNQLGKLLAGWLPQRTPKIQWQAQTS